MANNILSGCGVHHIALGVSDLERSLKFYTDGLGFSLVRSWQSGERTIAMVDIGDGSCLEIFSDCCGTTPTDKTVGTFFHLALRVNDSAAAFGRALEHGASAKMEPSMVELASQPSLPAVISFVYGPDGEQIEFFETR